MNSRTVLCFVTLSAMLAACAAPSPDRRLGPDQPVAYRAGAGTIESATVLSLASAPASAGGTAGPGTSATMAYRVKMADGSLQELVQTGERFEVGERAQVTSEGRLVRP